MPNAKVADPVVAEGFQFTDLDASKIFSGRLSKQTAKKYNEIWNNIKAHLSKQTAKKYN